MPSFKKGDVVKVPFPYTDRATRKFRPALVVSIGSIEDNHQLLWVVMITSAKNRAWPGDVAVNDLELAGLPVPSVIRTAKIATIEVSDAMRIGKISTLSLKQVMSKIGRELGI
jgi:mRNA interferase MazF